jgi:hypothetical protein
MKLVARTRGSTYRMDTAHSLHLFARLAFDYGDQHVFGVQRTWRSYFLPAPLQPFAIIVQFDHGWAFALGQLFYI